MPKYFRVAVLGGRKCGKTSLLQQLAYGSDATYKSPQDPGDTIEDIYAVMADSENLSRVRIYCHDTAGLTFPLSDTHTIMRHVQICDAVILMYAINDRQTFALVEQMKQIIDKHRDRKNELPMVVLANKCDKYRERLVPMEEGHTWGARERIKHFETCSHDRTYLIPPITHLLHRLTAQQSKSGFPQLGKKKASGISLEL